MSMMKWFNLVVGFVLILLFVFEMSTETDFVWMSVLLFLAILNITAFVYTWGDERGRPRKR